MELTLTPFEHQQVFTRFALSSDYVLCGDEPGLGKTLSSIGVACAMKKPTLCVVPAFLKHNWKAEFLKFTDLKEDEITIDKKLKESKVVITSYSQLKNARDWFKWADLVIADEAHYLKNITAARTKIFHLGIKEFLPERLVLLTGTPVKNRVDEFYSLLLLLSYCPSKANGKNIRDHFRSQYAFTKRYSHERSFRVGYRTITKFEGLKNEDELRTFFRGKYMRRLTKSVIDLPELRHKYVEAKYAFDDKELANFEKFSSKIDGHIMAIKSGAALAKAAFTASYAKNIFEESRSPVVIFSDHVDAVLSISGKLKRSAFITGSTSMEERHRLVQSFQSGKLDYIVATIGALSTGVTLTAARNLIFNDMSYVPADNAQATKRIHRIGQEFNCIIHKIYGSYIDKSIMTSLTSKEEVIKKIV